MKKPYNNRLKILFKFPTRGRPEKAKEALANIIEMVDNKRDYRMALTIDDNDKSLGDMKLVKIFDLFNNDNYFFIHGSSKSKIDAFNRGMKELDFFDWDILIAMSDDMKFVVKGFDDIIRTDMDKHFPDLDGMLHYNDGNQRDNVITMSIMGRKYYDRTHYIYNPSYKSLWCDVEATDVAKMLDKYVYLGHEQILFDHLHPAWGKAESDQQYKNSESFWEEDKKTYFRRRYDLNFDLSLDIKCSRLL